MEKKIYQIFANRENYGDYASADGIKFFLKDKCKDEIFFKEKFISYSDLSSDEIDEINNGYDFVVIGGGGLLRPHSKGLMLCLSEKSLKRIKKPIITYAIGINYEQFNGILKERLLNKINTLKKYIVQFSVRDRLSQDFLNEIGIESKLVPCPSFAVKSSEKFSIVKNYKKNIGIVLIPLLRLEKKKADVFLKTIKEFINKVKEDYNCFLIPHCSTVIDIYYEIIKDVNVPIIYSSDISQLKTAYEQMDFIFGTRGHSGLFAVGSKKPYVNLSYNIKCQAFSDLFDYSYPLVIDVNKISQNSLISALKYLEKHHEEIILKFSSVYSFFQRLNKEYVKIIRDKYF